VEKPATYIINKKYNTVVAIVVEEKARTRILSKNVTKETRMGAARERHNQDDVSIAEVAIRFFSP
jgi:hypothetical protein